MKIQKLIVWCSLLWIGTAGAQVANDDCTGGLAQGVGYLATWSTSCDVPGNSNNGAIISDSTHLAVPNFPYPANPSPCAGYTATVAAPANDRWYAVRVGCELRFTIECSDTCHISFWSGNDCAVLTPLDCFTILPNSPVTGSVSTLDNIPLLPDTLMLQISGNGIGQHTHYTLCLTNPVPPCNPIYVEPAPTPVICFLYETFVTPASSSSNADGAATIVMQLGNGPFSLVWDTGDTTQTLADLASGWHVFSITDAEGCQATDSVFIPVDTTVGMTWSVTDPSCGFRYNPVTNALVLGPDVQQADLLIVDATGRMIWTGASKKGDQSTIPLPRLGSGLHVVRSTPRVGLPCSIKFIAHAP